MSERHDFYHVYSSTMSPCSLDQDERDRALSTWLCNGCNGPRSGCGAVDVRIQPGAELDKPMTFIAGGFPGLVLKEFISQIDPVILERDLFLGRVLQANGELIEKWATFHGKYRLIVRGTRNISERVCADCRRRVYFAMGQRHLYPEPPGDADVYESDLSGLIFTNSAFRCLDVSKWRKGIQIDQLSVRNLSAH